MEYCTYIQVNPRIFRLENFIDIIESTHLGFKPKMVVVGRGVDDQDDLDLRYQGTATLKRIRLLPASDVSFESADLSVDLSWDDSGSIAFTGTSVRPTGLIEAFFGVQGFLDAASGDGDDRAWQNETSIKNYRAENRETEGLPRVWDPVWEREVIDVSGNPGRDSGTAGIGLWPAADLWYAPACGEFMDFAAVRTLPVGEVTELSNGVLHVHLFDDDTPEPEMRRRQQALRDHLRFDDLEARADDINLALGKRGEPVD